MKRRMNRARSVMGHGSSGIGALLGVEVGRSGQSLGSDMGSARAAWHDAALRADPAGAGAPSREEAKALARPAGAAEDSGAAAALDGKAPAKATQVDRTAGGAQASCNGAGDRAIQTTLTRMWRSKKGAMPPALHQPTFGHRQDSRPRHDQVIQHPHVDQRQCALKRLRQVLVGPRWVGHSRGMAVHQDHRRCIAR